eukprot:TRINITY_DN5554_c0_g3_i11.p1 TRINITY_DN5554_c0_g3~~TRINITY_DN5554_c0_g3_i11.p1  ORF type:complete len:103 (-),score=39.79 TRINITY_DN5554_c0_g3_i11:366-674(-)
MLRSLVGSEMCIRDSSLVGCKLDLDGLREVKAEEGLALAEKFSEETDQKVWFSEISAKEDVGMECTVARMVRARLRMSEPAAAAAVPATPRPKPNDGSCSVL